MAGEQHRRAGVGDILQHGQDALDRDRVESRERLVENGHLRAVHEGGCDLRTLLVAERQALHHVVRALGETEALEQLAGLRLCTVLGQPCSRARYTSCSATFILG